MRKIVLQGIIIVVSFFCCWAVLSKVDWMDLLQVKKATVKTEQKLGELFWDLFRKKDKEIKSPKIVGPIDSLVSKICKANGIDLSKVKLHILEKDEINAFALPDGHLVVYTGLIEEADNAEELCGVLGHELAHIEGNHVMKKLIKELGLTALLSVTTGQHNPELIKQAAKLLSSTAFDRQMEKEADVKSVDYLLKAGIDPLPFADFMYKLAEGNADADKYFSWISTHPESKQRAEYIVEYSKSQKKKGFKVRPIMTRKSWETLQDKVKTEKSDLDTEL
ncbi:M48 family metallopeptidase [Pseudopedobacter beijingensis]|uniref:M48 family metallopeptidase n=1 Tax=Pseudopedobacter beijingensis TaxID=1207056 RepID=A0ABW4IE76_9SPHI